MVRKEKVKVGSKEALTFSTLTNGKNSMKNEEEKKAFFKIFSTAG
jgi:hypothetical protein